MSGLIIAVLVVLGLIWFITGPVQGFRRAGNTELYDSGYRKPTSVKVIWAVFLLLPPLLIISNPAYFLGSILSSIVTGFLAFLYYGLGFWIVNPITSGLEEADRLRLYDIKRQQAEEEAKRQAEENQRQWAIQQALTVLTNVGIHYGPLGQWIVENYSEYRQVQESIRTGQMDVAATRSWLTQAIRPLPPAYAPLGSLLPLPGAALKQDEALTLPIGMRLEARFQHCYIIGKTGAGKTTLLRHMMLNDFAQGHGVGILAPEYELIEEQLLPFIPLARADDVIYFDPTDRERPVPFNPLYVAPGDDLSRAVDETLVAFSRAVGDTSPRMKAILGNTLYALMERPDSTLLDISRLLSRKDPGLRKEVIKTTKQELTAQFFEEQYAQYPKDAHLPILNRLDSLIRPEPLRNMLCQPGQSIDFREAMDTRKVMLFNLSDGVLGEGNSQLLGQLIVSRFQQALMTRATVLEESRVPFFLYLDEFQFFTNTSTDAFSQLFARARRYKMSLTLAHQNTSQIPEDLLRVILGNVGTLVSFHVSSQDAHKIGREFNPNDFWVRTSQNDKPNVDVPYLLENLAVGRALAKRGRTSFGFQVPPPPSAGDRALASTIKEHSRARYGVSCGSAPARVAREWVPAEAQSEVVATAPMMVKKPEKPKATDELEDYFE